MEALGKRTNSREAFQAELGSRGRSVREEAMFANDTHWRFMSRKTVSGGVELNKDEAGGLEMHYSPGLGT